MAEEQADLTQVLPNSTTSEQIDPPHQQVSAHVSGTLRVSALESVEKLDCLRHIVLDGPDVKNAQAPCNQAPRNLPDLFNSLLERSQRLQTREFSVYMKASANFRRRFVCFALRP
ncbi:MAG: hypothetical protein AAFW82_05405 [Pseudomonadota bacterium]